MLFESRSHGIAASLISVYLFQNCWCCCLNFLCWRAPTNSMRNLKLKWSRMIIPINTLKEKKINFFLRTECAFIYKKLSLLLKQNALCQVCMVEIEIGKFCQCIFRYFVFIFSRKRVWLFFWTNLNPFYPRILTVMFGWNLPSFFFG